MQQVRDALTGASSMDAQQVMNIFRELPAAWAKVRSEFPNLSML
jgi:hypothetical protein